VQETLESNIADIQGGTTGEGIQFGAMAGPSTWSGVDSWDCRREDALWLDPVPLPALSEYGFSLRCRGHRGVRVRRLSGPLQVGVPDSDKSAVRVVLADPAVTIAPRETCTLILQEDDPGG